jgi:hypothetical protein
MPGMSMTSVPIRAKVSMKAVASSGIAKVIGA